MTEQTLSSGVDRRHRRRRPGPRSVRGQAPRPPQVALGDLRVAQQFRRMPRSSWSASSRARVAVAAAGLAAFLCCSWMAARTAGACSPMPSIRASASSSRPCTRRSWARAWPHASVCTRACDASEIFSSAQSPVLPRPEPSCSEAISIFPVQRLPAEQKQERAASTAG